jgi:hypothetical protein
LPLRYSEIIFIDCIVALTHGHSFMAGDLHGREGIHAGMSEGCGGGVALIMEHDIGEPRISTYPTENLPDRLDA